MAKNNVRFVTIRIPETTRAWLKVKAAKQRIHLYEIIEQLKSHSQN